ncbi:polyketide synthase [Roseimaritima ulvae]|uniref:Uncharacterized protein n=1 Tax=Roseimaritima ulvae TaxID=980254 RepID=A0A5B9QTD2_9BACT|nr:polyketide synthase [Roseimaritima ulvae]QEG42268.1 hypothetical protein UC8_43020 [Roseimaritima ulvae]
MANQQSHPYLDPRLGGLLAGLRARVRRYIVWDSLLAIVAVLLAGFWIGILLDYVPVLLGGTEMPRSARLLLLIAVGGVLLVLISRLLVGRLNRSLPDDSLALLLERHNPDLGGRLITAVQLGDPHRSGDAHAPALLQEVHQQVAAAADSVDTSRVLRREPLHRKAYAVVPLLVAAAALLIFSPQVFGRAAGRLLLLTDTPWPRDAELEMVGLEIPKVTAEQDDTGPVQKVEFHDGVARLAKGANATLRIRAAADDAVVPDVCTLYYKTEDGTRGQANMRRVGRVVDGFQDFVLDGPPLSGLAGDLSFSIRGLDARLDDFRIETVPPPSISRLKVITYYPGYLRTDPGSKLPDMTTDYQPGLRLREGSRVQLVGTASKPLADNLDVLVTSGETVVPVSDYELEADGKTFRFTIADVRQPISVVIVPIDREQISAQAPFRYFFGVVSDTPPEIEMRLQGIDLAVTAAARIPIEGTILDDYGVTAAEVSVVPVIEQVPQPTSQPVQIDRNGSFSTALDLRELTAAGRLTELLPGQAVNVFGEAADGYDLGGEHLSRSEVYRLEIVTADALLALLERRELALRARLEQTIDETRSLRDSLDLLRREGWTADVDSVAMQSAPEPDPANDDENDAADRQRQILRLRIQQAGLQASKTSEELSGLATSVDDLLAEMVNNRVDSVDRRKRLSEGVADPLRKVVDGSLDTLSQQITGMERRLDEPTVAREQTALAVQSADQVLLELTAVLEKMLDLESYNEILDLVRSLMEAQDGLIDDTETERNQRIRDLFK